MKKSGTIADIQTFRQTKEATQRYLKQSYQSYINNVIKLDDTDKQAQKKKRV